MALSRTRRVELAKRVRQEPDKTKRRRLANELGRVDRETRDAERRQRARRS